MPYISGEDREALEPHAARDAMTMGELTYQITCLMDGYTAGNLDFQAGGEAMMAAEAAKLDFWRRIMTPYEDMKMAVNGDVYVTTIPTPGTRKVQA